MFVVKAQHDFDCSEAASQSQSKFISFKAGDSILVQQTHDNGWWMGLHLATKEQGFFPSNFVHTAKPPPPQPQDKQKEEENEIEDKDLSRQRRQVHSQYYQGIVGYKRIKLDQSNKGVLTNSFVKVEKETGMALLPVKDQHPLAKAMRHMGYFFDYNGWVDDLNDQGGRKKLGPDPTRRKQKRLKIKEWKPRQ